MQYNQEDRLHHLQELIRSHGFLAHCMGASHNSGVLCMCAVVVGGWVINEFGDIYPPEDIIRHWSN
jgi:hypothetical protein